MARCGARRTARGSVLVAPEFMGRFLNIVFFVHAPMATGDVGDVWESLRFCVFSSSDVAMLK